MEITTSPGNMTEQEARSCIDRVKHNLSSVRSDLLELYERQGWLALGYTSMRECLMSEFEESPSHLYRQVSAGLLERELESPIGDNRESHLRPLIRILEATEDRKAAYEFVVTTTRSDCKDFMGAAADFQRAAYEVHVSRHAVDDLAKRMRAGEISPMAAYHIARELHNMDDAFVRVAAYCSDPDLVPILKRLYYDGSETWSEITATMHIPSVDSQIPIDKAAASNLLAYLNIASNEHRAASIASNGEFYARLREATDAIIRQARINPHDGLAAALEHYDTLLRERK